MAFSNLIKANMAFAGVSLCLVGLGFASVRSTRNVIDANAGVVRSHEAIRELEGMAVALARGDAIRLSDDDPARSRRLAAINIRIRSIALRLHRLAPDDRVLRGRSASLLSLMSVPVFNEPAIDVRRGSASRLDQAERVVSLLLAEESQQLSERSSDSGAAIRLVWITETASGAFATAMLVLILCVMNGELIRRERAERRLAAQNSHLERAKTSLQNAATTDALTGIANRRGFDSRLDEEVSLAVKSGAPLSLLLLDVDHFKSYNDTYGHPAGDRILAVIASVLRNTVRESDLVARYGGEEFGAILPGSHQFEALEAAERIRVAVESFEWPDRAITVSVGAATISKPHGSAASLISAADEALYRAKTSGRNRALHQQTLLSAA